MSDKETEEKIDDLAGNMVLGLEKNLTALGESLPEQVDGMTQKQLRRALKATINYIYKKEDGTDATALSDREKKFLGGMFALVETGAQYTMHIISELHQQQEQEKKNG